MSNVYDDIPTSFDGMFSSADWSQRFLRWAEEQPDWTGPLTRAVWSMRDWSGGSVEDADAVVADLNLATPPIDANETLTRQQPFAWVDDSGNVPADYFQRTYAHAYEILAGNPYIYAAFYEDHNQTLADNSVTGKRHFEAKRGVDEADRTEYVTRHNVWIQNASGESVIMASSAQIDSDTWFQVTPELADFASAENQKCLDAMDDGETAWFGQWYDLIILGDSWNTRSADGSDEGAGSLRQVCEWYGSTGAVTIEKGSTFSRGTLTFSGAHDQDAVKNHIAGFSKKTCYFE